MFAVQIRVFYKWIWSQENKSADTENCFYAIVEWNCVVDFLALHMLTLRQALMQREVLIFGLMKSQ